MMIHETNEKSSKNIGSYFEMTGNIERIGDHAVNICDYTNLLRERQITFSKEAVQEMQEMREICRQMFDRLRQAPENPEEWLQKIHDSENFIDKKTDEFYENHLERIRKGLCNDEACVVFSELLTDFERIGDHLWNIAKEMGKVIERS